MSEVKPATDKDLVTFRQWNHSMLSHPTLAVRTVVEMMDARIKADAAIKAKLLADCLSLKDRLAKLEAVPAYRVEPLNLDKLIAEQEGRDAQ